MTTKAKAHSPVITVMDPESAPEARHGEQGGTAQWRTDSPTYPAFDLTFQGKNPSDTTPNKTFHGTEEKPAVVRLANTGDYSYTIKHIKKDGSSVNGGMFTFSVGPCKNC